MGPGVPLFRMQPSPPGESIAKLPNRPIIRLALFRHLPHPKPSFSSRSWSIKGAIIFRTVEEVRKMSRFGIFFFFLSFSSRRIDGFKGFLNANAGWNWVDWDWILGDSSRGRRNWIFFSEWRMEGSQFFQIFFFFFFFSTCVRHV